MNEFEQKLQRQALRQIPADWRGEILSAAQSASRPAPSDPFLSTINQRLVALLWPHPKAWAGLAAVWILIIAVNFTMRDKTPVMAEKAPPSPEVVAELKQQQKMLAELMGSREATDADRPKTFVPRPRSEYAEILTG